MQLGTTDSIHEHAVYRLWQHWPAIQYLWFYQKMELIDPTLFLILLAG